MDCPLYVSGRRAGILRVVPEGRNTRFTLQAEVGAGLYRVCARGEKADLPLGAWEGGAMSRLFSRELTAPAGRILCAEAVPVGETDRTWSYARAEQFPGWPVRGGLCRCRCYGRELALPFDDESPFPIPALFCLARIIRLDGRIYAVFFFDGEGRPGFPPVF